MKVTCSLPARVTVRTDARGRQPPPRGAAVAAARRPAGRSRVSAPACASGTGGERLDGRTLESVEAIGKNLVLRFEGGVVLRSHLRHDGPVDSQPARRSRAGASRGSCSAARASRAFSGTAPCSSCTRARSRGSARTSSSGRHASTTCSRGCSARTDALLRRDAARPVARRGHREHVACRGAVGRVALAVAAPRRCADVRAAAARSRPRRE